MDAVAAGLGADVDDGIAGAAGSGEEKFVLRRDAEREDVDQRIAGVAGLEGDFAADGGHAEAVAVMRDAAHDAVEQAAIARDDFGRDARTCGVMGPKRSESSTAMGRAPMVKTSRRMPPTPVAAP